ERTRFSVWPRSWLPDAISTCGAAAAIVTRILSTTAQPSERELPFTFRPAASIHRRDYGGLGAGSTHLRAAPGAARAVAVPFAATPAAGRSAGLAPRGRNGAGGAGPGPAHGRRRAAPRGGRRRRLGQRRGRRPGARGRTRGR